MLGVILALRVAAELGAVVGPLLVWMGHRRGREMNSHPSEAVQVGSRTPLAANVVALAVFFSSLWLPFGILPLPTWADLAAAIVGVATVVAGAFLCVTARGALGASWSLAPKASTEHGLATGGLYRWVRHPIYLGFAVMFGGTAVAFANWISILVLLLLVVPTLMWRAAVEERLLTQVFGEQYVAYRRRTGMIIPMLWKRTSTGPIHAPTARDSSDRVPSEPAPY